MCGKVVGLLRWCIYSGNLALLLFWAEPVGAHDPDRAYFTITASREAVIIKAEIPWTVRNALLKFRPELHNATSKQDFLAAFEDYVRQNITLHTRGGHHLMLLTIEILPSAGHLHQETYRLVFEGGDLLVVKNTFLFDLHEHQLNTHYVVTGADSLLFQTTPLNPGFKIARPKPSDPGNRKPIMILSVASISFLFVFLLVARMYIKR